MALLNRQKFDSLNHDEQIDYLLFANYLAHEIKELERQSKQFEEMSVLLPFAKTINDLEDSRRKLETIDAAKTAALLNNLNKQIIATQKNLSSRDKQIPETITKRWQIAAAQTIVSLRRLCGIGLLFTTLRPEFYLVEQRTLQSG